MKKICSCCKKEKDISDFNFRNKNKRKRFEYCKKCHSIRMKEDYKRHKEGYLFKKKVNSAKAKERFTEFKKTLKCSKCGYDKCPDAIDFHHIDSSVKENNISNLRESWEKLMEEIKKCVVLCSNCHRELHYLEKQMPH
jgi:hypothetical protein